MAVEKQDLSRVPVEQGTRLLTAVLRRHRLSLEPKETSEVNGAGGGVHLPHMHSLLPEEIK